jgi:hypothetical protein
MGADVGREVRVYVSLTKDILYATLTIATYYLLRWRGWIFVATHGLSWVVMWLVYTSDENEINLSTLALTLTYITVLADVFVGFNVSCHLTTCCLPGQDYAPFSIKYPTCSDTNPITMGAAVYVALFCCAFNVLSGVFRLTSLAHIRKGALLEVASAVVYVGLKVYLLFWTSVKWPMLLFVQSIVLMGLNGVGVAFSFRSKMFGYAVLAAVLALDMVSVLGMYDVLGTASVHAALPSFNVYGPDPPRAISISDQVRSAFEALDLAVQTPASTVALNANAIVSTITITGCCAVVPQIPTVFQTMQTAAAEVYTVLQGDAAHVSAVVTAALAAAAEQTDQAFARLPVPDAPNMVLRYNQTVASYAGTYGLRASAATAVLAEVSRYVARVGNSAPGGVEWYFYTCYQSLQSYVPTLSPQSAHALFAQANASCVPFATAAVQASQHYAAEVHRVVQKAKQNEQSLLNDYFAYLEYTEPVYQQTLWHYMRAKVRTLLKWVAHELRKGKINFRYTPMSYTNGVLNSTELPEIVFTAAVTVMLTCVSLTLVEGVSIYMRAYPVNTGAIPFFGVHLKGDEDEGAEGENDEARVVKGGGALGPRKRAK